MGRALRALVAVVLLALTSSAHESVAQGQLECTIERAHARVWAQLNQGGQVLYYGHAIMYTRGCKELSPGDIEVTFRPMAGATSTCDPRGTLYSDEAVCTTGVGAATQGTQILITASGKTFGAGGAGAFASACTVVLPAYDNASCAFPIVLTS